MFFDFIDISVCLALVMIPFRDRLQFNARVASTVCLLYIFVIVSRWLSWSGYVSDDLISLIRLIAYFGLFRSAIQAKLSKLLFVLLVVLNYFSFIVIFLNYLSGIMFAVKYANNPFSFQSAFLMAVLLGLSFPLIYWLMDKKIRPVIHSSENKRMWNYIWLVPAIFCLIFHYSVLENGGTIAFSAVKSHVVYAFAVNTGSLLVTYLIVKLVEESNANLVLKNENYQLTLQSLQYENLKNHMEEARRARHDLRHNMTLIQSYLDSGSYGEMETYIRQYFTTLPSDTPIMRCDNYAVNAVIVYYEDVARKKQIHFTVDVECQQPLGIRDTDAAVLMGNLLENAVEACCKKMDTPPFILLVIRQKGGAVIIAVDNSYNGELYREEGGFRSTKENRMGIGISSIQRIAETYNGMAKFEYDDKVFSASIMLNP